MNHTLRVSYGPLENHSPVLCPNHRQPGIYNIGGAVLPKL